MTPTHQEFTFPADRRFRVWVRPRELMLFGALAKEDVFPYFWANGKVPTCAEWTRLSDDGFRDYRLSVHGLVEHPVALSLDEIRALGKQEQITEHNCIQGWSGTAAWGGLPLSKLVALVKPAPEATFVAFHSFGEGLYGGEYYDCHSIANVLHPQSLLAYEMNGGPLGTVHGPFCGSGSRTSSVTSR
jgi:DMSO/TMAO reductase YedYZ molybdopterin-dependent catalytic subunit